MEKLKIGQVAGRAGVTPDTVRYYEERGLIPVPARRGSGAYRYYRPEIVERIQFIKEAQELGFTLGDIEDLLRLKDAPDTRCDDVRLRAREKLQEIEEKIAGLVQIRKTLANLVAQCESRDDAPLSECPIISAMEDHDEG